MNVNILEEAKSVGTVIEGVPIAPVVICGICFQQMGIEEWCGDVPHPNRGHLCACGKYWMPSSGNIPLTIDGDNGGVFDFGWVLFFHACGDQLHD